MFLEGIKQKYPEIKSIFFEKDQGQVFLRVEVRIKDLRLLELFSKKLSQTLDQFEQEIEHQSYFLDVYSDGTDQELNKDNLSDYLQQNVLIDLNKPIANQKKLIGTIEEISPLIILWNNRGQYRKQEIKLTNIKSIKLYAKVGR